MIFIVLGKLCLGRWEKFDDVFLIFRVKVFFVRMFLGIIGVVVVVFGYLILRDRCKVGGNFGYFVFCSFLDFIRF